MSDTQPKNAIFSVLKQLEGAHIFFQLGRFDSESIMVTAVVPGERWEIQVFEDGKTEIEIFKSSGEILSAEILQKIIERHRD
ncbi:MAG: hypothetical protein JO256_03155 [Alphaproteobacteria bacterium]|nr:hypothetical protein [Alphaproteobacteria bacterium]